MCIPGSDRHAVVLTLEIIVGALCCWCLLGMGTAGAQSDLPDLPDLAASSTQTTGVEESIVPRLSLCHAI